MRFESASRSQLRAAPPRSTPPPSLAVNTLRLIMMTGAFATPVAVLAACQSLPLLCSLPLLIIASVDVGVVVLPPYAAVWVLGPARPAVASTSHQFTASACEACQRVFFFCSFFSPFSIYFFKCVRECVRVPSICMCDTLQLLLLFLLPRRRPLLLLHHPHHLFFLPAFVVSSTHCFYCRSPALSLSLAIVRRAVVAATAQIVI